MRLKLWLNSCVLSLAATSTAWAAGYAGGNISVSDKSADLGVFSLKETATDVTRLGANYFYNSPGDKFIGVHLQVNRKGWVSSDNLDFGVKAKAFYLSRNKYNDDGYGLMLGLAGRYWFPTAMPMAISAEWLYSPQIITGGKAENATDARIRGELRILPKVIAFIGYRNLEAKFSTHGTHNLDSSLHIGVEGGF